MKRALVATVALATLAGGGATAIARTAAGTSRTAASTGCPATSLCAGVGVMDATWHVGSGAGQYASDMGPSDPRHPDAGAVIAQEWDPSVEHVKQQSSYGVASRLSIRAIVVRDGRNDPPVALVKDDNYLAQDMLTRRVGQILAADGSAVTYDHILMSATHDHNSPYYATPAAGVWLFQDAMDLRMFEYQAQQMAKAIEAGERSMVPARVGGTTVQFPDFQGNIAGSDRNEDGSPTGYPAWDNDHGLVVLRFDNMSDPSNPKPLATYINYAEHGESLDGYNIISADWLAPFQRYVDRATGVPMVFSQGSVGSAEGPYDYANPKMANDGGDRFPEIWAHEGYAQAERGTHLMAERVVDAWNAIENNDSSVQAPFPADPNSTPVTMLTHWVAGPVSHPYPSVGNCRTGPTGNGDPGVPAAGLPDCQRMSDAFSLPFAPHFAEQLKSAGIPLPDNYDATSFGTVEENLRIKLQAVRLGDTLLASCSCEAQADLIRNLESRTDNVPRNQYNGFDYNSQADVDEGWPAAVVGHRVDACYAVDGSTYSCPDPRDRWGNARVTMSKAAFDHMEYEINNDAAGWNDPSYAAQAGSEPADSSQIKGNFTHSELGVTNADGAYGSCPGYKLSIGLGHTGDYDGYTVSYREYMARDAYRKALTSYGPHTADYMVTNLVGMAANLMCGAPLIAQPTDPIATADEGRQLAEATALGQISSAYYTAWAAQLPDNAGPARPLAQPASVSRFDVTQFAWVGGDNYTDNPTVTVQRLVDGQWQTYADQSGEVQVFLDQPQDMIDALPTYRSNMQQWNWRASFEVFDAYPRADVPGGQVPNGTYRFAVDGLIHTGGAAAPYHLKSQPFTVTPWTGIGVRDLQRNGSQVSFVVDPITYPKTPPAAHTADLLWYHDPRDTKGNHGPVCELCSFRPWATSGQVASAVVQVNDGNGRVQLVPAAYDATTGRWVASVPPGQGLTVSVPAGGVRDTYGEVNGKSLTL